MNATLTDYRAPRDVLRAAVAASREIAQAERSVEACVRTLEAARAELDAAIERRGETLDAIAEMMRDADAEVVTFYDGPRYFAAIRNGDLVTLTPASSPTALSLDSLLPKCVVPDRYQDGGHAATGGDERLDPFPPARFNPEMRTPVDADAMVARFMDRIQSGGIDVPSDDDLEEAARHAAFHDLFAPPSAHHVRPSIEDLARGFAVPDDMDGVPGTPGFGEGVESDDDFDLDVDDDDLDDDDEPDDAERTTEFPPVAVPADDVVVSQDVA